MSDIDYSGILMNNKDKLKEYIQIYFSTNLPIKIISVKKLYTDGGREWSGIFRNAFDNMDKLYTIEYTLYNITRDLEINISKYNDWVASKRNEKIDNIIS